MQEYLTNDTEKVISDFLPVLRRMTNQKSGDLISGILSMQRYGVEAFATRLIYPDGYSSLFSTSINWARMNKGVEFQQDFKNHLSTEIVKIFKNKLNVISRAGNKIYSPFLKRLEEGGVNNSILISEFCNEVLEITYFMGAPNDYEARDLILNNLECLKLIKKRLKASLQEIFTSPEFKSKKELLLNDTAISEVWGKPYTDKKTGLIMPLQYQTLTSREIACLGFLNFGSTNQFIAEKMDISLSTVKFHLMNLKTKLGVSSREELIKIAQNPSMTNIAKIMGIGGVL